METTYIAENHDYDFHITDFDDEKTRRELFFSHIPIFNARLATFEHIDNYMYWDTPMGDNDDKIVIVTGGIDEMVLGYKTYKEGFLHGDIEILDARGFLYAQTRYNHGVKRMYIQYAKFDQGGNLMRYKLIHLYDDRGQLSERILQVFDYSTKTSRNMFHIWFDGGYPVKDEHYYYSDDIFCHRITYFTGEDKGRVKSVEFIHLDGKRQVIEFSRYGKQESNVMYKGEIKLNEVPPPLVEFETVFPEHEPDFILRPGIAVPDRGNIIYKNMRGLSVNIPQGPVGPVGLELNIDDIPENIMF